MSNEARREAHSQPDSTFSETDFLNLKNPNRYRVVKKKFLLAFSALSRLPT